MLVFRVARVKREKERIVGVVGVRDAQAAEVEGVITGYGCEISIQQVVLFFV